MSLLKLCNFLKKTGENLCDLGLSEEFLDKIPKEKYLNRKSDNVDFFKTPVLLKTPFRKYKDKP